MAELGMFGITIAERFGGADFAVVLAVTDRAAGKRGVSIFLVDRDRPGFRAGRQEHKMGQCASQIGALHFEEVSLLCALGRWSSESDLTRKNENGLFLLIEFQQVSLMHRPWP